MKLVFLYGPPAVGKLTIAKILEEQTGYKLLHNHLLVNPIAEVFPFENPANNILVREFRLRSFEEAVKSNINLIATFGITGNSAFAHIADIVRAVERNKGEACLIQITANQETILNRVDDQFRKDHGKNLSKEKLKEILNNNPDLFNKYPEIEHLSINTAGVSPKKAAEKIIEFYQL